MKRMKKRILLLVVFILFMICVLFVPQREKNEGRIRVAVSIPPQAEFVERIGGDRVEVMVMVPPGASPHTYEPTPSQLRDVSKAEIYAKVGSGVEFELAWMDKIASVNKEMLIVDCSKGIKFIEKDPHVWLSPRNARIMVENIYKGLVKVDPVNKEYYQKNKEKYLEELERLDNEIAQAISKKRRRIMVYHPAWAYFCRDYGLEQIAIEREGKEPTPKGILNLIEQARRDNIKVIFASPEFSTKGAEVIAKEINGTVILISPLEKNYLENMRKVAKAFAEV